MSLPAMHTAVGMSFPFLVGFLRFLKVRKITSKMLLWIGGLMLFCGFWAEVPDLPRFLPQKYHYLENEITNSKYANIFFFHGFLDSHQTEDRGLREGAGIIFAIFFLTLFGCARQVSVNQRRIDSLLLNISKKSIEKPKTRKEYKNLTDIHCHVLPGLDDGPDNMEEALKMCEKMAKLGIRYAVASPHIPWKGEYKLNEIKKVYAELVDALEQKEILLKLSLGGDIRIDWDLTSKFKRGELFTINAGRYFLLEPDDYTLPTGFEVFLKKCIDSEIYPILTHAERNSFFVEDIDIIKRVSQLPVLIQLTSCSLVGTFGSKVKDMAEKLLKENLVDIIVSDAHSTSMRLDEYREGLYAAEEIVGFEKVNKMAVTVPKMVIDNEDLDNIVRVSRG